MKRIFICTALALALFAPELEAAEGGIYLGLSGALSLVDGARNDSREGSFNFDYKTGYAGAITLGYDLRENYPNIGIGRVELEASYRSNELDEVGYLDARLVTQGDVRVASLMLNTFGEYRGSLPLIPYVGGGIGLARVKIANVRFEDLLLIDDSDVVFAWQVGGGFGWQMGRYLALDLGYRYFSAVDLRFTDAEGVRFKSRYDNHLVLLGARIDF
jgi:opacity protein-like surface antigen